MTGRFTLATLVVAAAALSAQAALDRETLAKIQDEGLHRSQVAPVFEMLTVTIGPRLTASPAHKRAADWARDRLAAFGLSNARLEPWRFGRGWTLEKLTAELSKNPDKYYKVKLFDELGFRRAKCPKCRGYF